MSDSIKELFVSIYGGPIYFTMKACTEKKELQQLISCWGGEMTETTGPHTIHLVSKGEEAPKTGDSFHVQYIYDCIDKERLLLIDKYRVNKNSCYVGNMTAMWVMLGKSSWPDCQLKRNDGMVNEVTSTQDIYETRAPDPSVRNNPGPSIRNNPGPSVRNNPGPSVRNNPGPSVRNNPGPSVRNYPGPSVRNNQGPLVRNNPGPSVRNNPGPSVRNDQGPSGGNDTGPSVRNNPGPSVRNDQGPSGGNDPGPSGGNDTGPSGGNDQGPSVRNNPGPSVRNNQGPSVRNNPGPSVRNNPGPSVRNNPSPSVRNDPGPSGGNDPGPSGGNDPGPSGGNDQGPSSRNNSSTRKKKYTDCNTRENADIIHGSEVERQNHAVEENSILPKTNTGVSHMEEEERQEPHVEISPGRQNCLDCSEPFSVNLPIFIQGTGRCEGAMSEGFQPLDVDNEEDVSTDIYTESDSEGEETEQFKLKLELTDSSVDVCEETQASELQDHTQRAPKNDEVQTFIPETEDLDNVENLEDVSTSRNNELEMEENCKSISSQETNCDIIDGMQNTLSEDELLNTGSLVESVIPLNKKHTSVEVSQEKDGMQGELSKENRKPGDKNQNTLITSSLDLISNSIDVDRGVVVEISHSITRNKPNETDGQNSEAEGQPNFAVPVPENITEDDINQMQQLLDCVALDIHVDPSPTKNDADITKLKPPSNKDSLTEQSPAQAPKSVARYVIPDANFNQKILTDGESSCESGSSTCFSSSCRFVIKDEQNLKNHMRSNEKDASPLKDDNTVAPIQKDSSYVDTSPEERQISYMAAGQPKTRHRSIRYTKRALREQYSTSPEEKNRKPRSEIVTQRSIPTKPDGNHVLQGALSVKPTRTAKRAASPEKRKKLTKLYDTYDSDNIESEDDHSVLSEDDFNTSEDEEIPQKGDQNASLPDKALYRDSFTGRFDRLYNPTTGCKLGDKRRSVNTIRKIRPYEPYSVVEDLAIIKYIEKHQLQAAAGGIKMWRKMERAGVLRNRTVQGMKERYIKRILPRIHCYLQLGLSEKTMKKFQRFASRRHEACRSNGVGGRRPYSFREDSLIVNFILKNKRFSEVGGNTVWETMAATVPGLNRSWQSLKQHYRKYTVNHLQDFQLTDKELAMFRTSGASERRNGKHFTRMIKSNTKRDEETSSNNFKEDNSSEPDSQKRKSANERKRQKHTDEEFESHNEEKIKRKSKEGETRSRDNYCKPSRTDHIQSPQVNRRIYVAKRKLFKFGEVAKLTPQAPFVSNGVGSAIIQRKFLSRGIYSSSEEEQQKCTSDEASARSPHRPQQQSPHRPQQQSPRRPQQQSPHRPQEQSPHRPQEQSPHRPQEQSTHRPQEQSLHSPQEQSLLGAEISLEEENLHHNSGENIDVTVIERSHMSDGEGSGVVYSKNQPVANKSLSDLEDDISSAKTNDRSMSPVAVTPRRDVQDRIPYLKPVKYLGIRNFLEGSGDSLCSNSPASDNEGESPSPEMQLEGCSVLLQRLPRSKLRRTVVHKNKMKALY